MKAGFTLEMRPLNNRTKPVYLLFAVNIEENKRFFLGYIYILYGDVFFSLDFQTYRKGLGSSTSWLNRFFLLYEQRSS